ncbi:hypothetical protein L916_06792, partial [Phytophthora nicotianae]
MSEESISKTILLSGFGDARVDVSTRACFTASCASHSCS